MKIIEIVGGWTVMKYLDDKLTKQDDLGYCNVYIAFLLFKDKPIINRERLYNKMERYTGKVDVSNKGKSPELMVFESKGSDEPIIFFHMNHNISYSDGHVPAQTFMSPFENIPEISEDVFSQAWDFENAKSIVSECKYCLSQILMMSGGMNYKNRLDLFRNALRATLETVKCDIMYWQPSMKFIDPVRFLENFDSEQLYGAFNIRLYNIAGNEQKQPLLMDTCGLAALGLPDLQCHFYDLAPNDVAGKLFDLAYYIFENGDVIADGNTVFEEYWKCQHEYSIIPPKRQVLDLNPGKPFYAG